jgi:hypothetical protein
METTRQKKTALDRLMQVISLALIAVVLVSALGSVRAAEETSPRTSQTRFLQATPSPTPSPQTTATLVSRTAAAAGAATVAVRPGQVQPLAGSWPTWVLKSGREIQVAPPPSSQATAVELDILRDLVSHRDAATRATIQYWDAGSPSYRWLQLALQQLQTQSSSIPRANQALAMLNVAVYESMVTVWQAKYMYARPRPADLAPDLAAIATPASPSYPDEYAAAAGAASAVLSFLYPQQADHFAALALEAAQSRAQAGVAFLSDVEAGLSLGRTIAGRVIAYTGIAGTADSGPGIAAWWATAAAHEPLSLPWRPWTLAYAGALLPPEPGAATLQATRAGLLDLQRAHAAAGAEARSAAVFWTSFAGTHAYWYDLATKKMAEYHLDENPVKAARIYALMSVAHDDSSNACWDAMYTYRVVRPAAINGAGSSSLTPVVPYMYPAAHACLAGSMSVVLSAAFSLDARAIQMAADDAAQAGLWIDGALPGDIQAGFALGRLVALHVLSHPLSWLWSGE